MPAQPAASPAWADEGPHAGKRSDRERTVASSRPATAGWPPWRYLPLCEINRLDMPRFYALALPGIRAWAETTDTIGVITSRMPETYRQLWPRLRRDVPGVRFLPGLKLSGHPTRPVRIDDPAVWRSLAEAVRTSLALTGSDTALLDTESGVNPWLRDEYEIEDWQAVERGIALLPPTRYLLYPPVRYGEKDPRHAKTDRFTRAFVKIHPNSVLVTFGWSTQATSRQSYYQRMQGINQAIAPAIDICYSYESSRRRNDWRPEALPKLLAECPRPFIVYGWSQDPGNARQLAQTMKVLDIARQAADATEDLRTVLEEALAQAQTRGALPE